MPTDRTKEKNARNLAAFKRRNSGRTCRVPDCIRKTEGTAAECSRHRTMKQRVGNPTGQRLTRDQYGDYIDYVTRLWRINAKHPGTPAAIAILYDWLNGVVKAQDVRGKFRTHAIGEYIGLSCIQQGVTPRQLLLEMSAVFAWAQSTGRVLPPFNVICYAL